MYDHQYREERSEGRSMLSRRMELQRDWMQEKCASGEVFDSDGPYARRDVEEVGGEG